MYCPRLNHFVRLNPSGTVSRCGHMVKPPEFKYIQQMEQSQWLLNVRDKFAKGEWPSECVRCEKSEAAGEKSIRQYAIDAWEEKSLRPGHLQVGGVLDNVCNAACQTCDENHSTLIGTIKKNKVKVDNLIKFHELPWDRITHLDLNGGEPSYSANYKDILKNPPPNLKSIRLNTNCTTTLWELGRLADNGVDVTVTISLDGVERVHEYMRWPITWETFYKNLQVYQKMPINLNTWTTVSALNIGDFNNIVKFTKEENIDHSWAFLESPKILSAAYSNSLTSWAKISLPEEMAKFVAVEENNQELLDAYITEQDRIRKISIKDYIK